MENLKDKGNNELKGLLKGLEMEHAAVKLQILKNYETMKRVEKEFEQIKVELKKRLNL